MRIPAALFVLGGLLSGCATLHDWNRKFFYGGQPPEPTVSTVTDLDEQLTVGAEWNWDAPAKELGVESMLKMIDSDWPKSEEAKSWKSWLETREAECWFTGDEASRMKAESILQRISPGWAADRSKKTVAPIRFALGPGARLTLPAIYPGEFTMGSPESEPHRSSDEGPQTRVVLTRGYWLGRTEVTQGQWEALMGTNPSHFKYLGRFAAVQDVSWSDAIEFCRKLTERERSAGRLPAGYEYTLPTEAQWEYACRAGSTGPHAASGDLGAVGLRKSKSDSKRRPARQRQPNAWGLYDMQGSVWEWCRDWYGSYPGFRVTDPMGPSEGTWRVMRGGYRDFPSSELEELCRSALRFWSDPEIRDHRVGFRIALSSIVAADRKAEVSTALEKPRGQEEGSTRTATDLAGVLNADDRIVPLKELDERPVLVMFADLELGFDEWGLSPSAMTATISCIVERDGTPTDLQVESATDVVLGKRCLSAVAQWRFKPGMIKGVPVRTRVSIPFKM